MKQKDIFYQSKMMIVSASMVSVFNQLQRQARNNCKVCSEIPVQYRLTPLTAVVRQYSRDSIAKGIMHYALCAIVPIIKQSLTYNY